MMIYEDLLWLKYVYEFCQFFLCDFFSQNCPYTHKVYTATIIFDVWPLSLNHKLTCS